MLGDAHPLGALVREELGALRRGHVTPPSTADAEEVALSSPVTRAACGGSEVGLDLGC